MKKKQFMSSGERKLWVFSKRSPATLKKYFLKALAISCGFIKD